MTARKREDAQAFLKNLAEFIGGTEETREELISSLKARGLDADAALADFRRVLDEHAPVWREEARLARRAALADVQQSTFSPATSRAGLLETINGLLAAMRALGSPVETGAYHRDFQEATDEDLRSLAADLTAQLESLKRKK